MKLVYFRLVCLGPETPLTKVFNGLNLASSVYRLDFAMVVIRLESAVSVECFWFYLLLGYD